MLRHFRDRMLRYFQRHLGTPARGPAACHSPPIPLWPASPSWMAKLGPQAVSFSKGPSVMIYHVVSIFWKRVCGTDILTENNETAIVPTHV